jgi:hypothetical protein
MSRLLTKLRNSKNWLKNYLLGSFLYHLFIASLITTGLDIGSTWIALGIWPEIFVELSTLPYCMIDIMGLPQALLMLLCLRAGISYLLYYSKCRYRTRFIGLLVMTGGGLYYGTKNFYYIFQVLML